MSDGCFVNPCLETAESMRLTHTNAKGSFPITVRATESTASLLIQGRTPGVSARSLLICKIASAKVQLELPSAHLICDVGSIHQVAEGRDKDIGDDGHSVSRLTDEQGLLGPLHITDEIRHKTMSAVLRRKRTFDVSQETRIGSHLTPEAPLRCLGLQPRARVEDRYVQGLAMIQATNPLKISLSIPDRRCSLVDTTEDEKT